MFFFKTFISAIELIKSEMCLILMPPKAPKPKLAFLGIANKQVGCLPLLVIHVLIPEF